MNNCADYTIRNRRGAALLAVLLVVITISTLSVGYVALSDMELGAGVNMALRYEMDYLAESGLEYARIMLLNPHRADGSYWHGRQELQLGSEQDIVFIDDIVRSDNSEDSKEGRRYTVGSHAYRNRGSEQVGSSQLHAEVVLEPAIALWIGDIWDSQDNILIKGDVFGRHDVRGKAEFRGNVYSRGSIEAPAVVGRKHENIATGPVDWPGVLISDYSSTYYTSQGHYSTTLIDPNDFSANPPAHSGSNPAHVLYCDQDLVLEDSIHLDGTLIVNGDLTIQTSANEIRSRQKGFPALIVSGKIIIEEQSRLYIRGLAQVGHRVVIESDGPQPRLAVDGALFIETGGIASGSQSVHIVSYPDLAAIKVWDSSDTGRTWTPAGGARLNRLSRE